MRLTVKSSDRLQPIPALNREMFSLLFACLIGICVQLSESVCCVVLCCSDSCQKGWRLLYILTAFYRCSEVLKPFLLKFLRDVCRSPEVLFHGNYTYTVHI